MTSGWEPLEKVFREEMENGYSDTVIEHAVNPRNAGDITDADSFAQVTGPCGDTMEIWLKVNNDTITRATFMTDGCGTSIAAGSMVTELARGKSIVQALRIGQQDVLDALSGLPEDSEHCALLAADTLKEAVKEYLALKKEPWKKNYKRY